MGTIVQMTSGASPQTFDDWKAYIAEATEAERTAAGSIVDAIIVKGTRIAAFHAAYKANAQRWGRTWEDACVEGIGASETTCSKYETIAKNPLRTAKDILPSSLDSLYYLTRAARADPEGFQAAVVAGVVKPNMTRPRAAALAKRAEGKKPSKPPVQRLPPPPRALPPGALPKFSGTIEDWRAMVDPEFTGSPTDFTDKYGHVQVMTAERYATERFGAWATNMGAVAKEAKRMPDWPNVDHNWLRSPRARDIAKLTEALEYLLPKIAEAEALLQRALAARPAPDQPDAVSLLTD